MNAAAEARRKKLIRLVQVAKRDLAMPEDDYRQMLRTASKGKDSCADMNALELEAVLAHAKKAGFKVRAKAGERSQDTSAEAAKVRALWLFLHQLGEVQNPSEAALALYVKRIAKVDDMRWAGPQAMQRLIETLKKWAMRRALPEAVRLLLAEATQAEFEPAPGVRAGLLPGATAVARSVLQAHQGPAKPGVARPSYEAMLSAWDGLRDALGEAERMGQEG